MLSSSAPAPAPAPSAASTPAHPAPTGKAFRGWAPPEKDWDKTETKKSDETRIEIQDEWDEEGNLTRTTIKKIKTPDWKIKTETTVEEIPAEEAKKFRK
eukprot:scaffold2649_cov137-Cylindrotheca_fusiformis.AAC.13